MKFSKTTRKVLYLGQKKKKRKKTQSKPPKVHMKNGKQLAGSATVVQLTGDTGCAQVRNKTAKFQIETPQLLCHSKAEAQQFCHASTFVLVDLPSV